MRYILFLVFISGLNTCFAQDDFPDYRSKKDVFKRITEKDIRSDIASFSMAGLDENVGKLPLKTIPVTNYGANFLEFTGNDIKVKITGGTFDPSKHKMTYIENKYLVKIDNKPFFGDYGKMPKTTIEEVSLIIENDTIRVPAVALIDLYNPIYTHTQNGTVKSHNNVYISADGKKIYVYMLKVESGGSYEVTWVFRDKKFVQRVVDFGFLP